MIKRTVSSIALICLLAIILPIDWLSGLLVTIFTVAGLYEFFTMLETKGISIYKYFGIGMGLVIPLSILLRFEVTKTWELLFVVAGLLVLILMQFRRRQNTGVVVDISTTIFGILYVSWFLSFLIKIRYLPGGIGLFFSIVLITKSCDIGAYLIGVRFGRRPLMPRISPKKSIEGAMGGLLFSLLATLAVQSLLQFSYLQAVFVGIFLGILGQLGDLSESLIKRDCGAKDSGGLIPGIGGALDLIDSLLFTAPAFYFYMSFVVHKL